VRESWRLQAVTARIALSNGKVILTWTAVPGKSYRLLYKENLADAAWKMLQPEVLVSGSVATVEDSVAGQPQRFYRIVER
jgi:hypothetical protein